MRLSDLKQKTDKALKKHGDMEVAILIVETETCDKCGQSKENRYESIGKTINAYLQSDRAYYFWVEGEME